MGAGRSNFAVLLLAACALTGPSLQQVLFQTVQITEFMRHGARTTWRSVLNLPITSALGVGNLTANGMRMHFLLGSQVRKNYPSLFSQPFTNFDVELFSSSSVRTISSLQSHVLGMFPLGVGEELSVDTTSKYTLPPFKGVQSALTNSSALPQAYRPLPYQIRPINQDYLFMPSMYTYCVKANDQITKQKATTYSKYQPLFSDLSKQVAAAGFDSQKYVGTAEWSLNDVAQVYDEFKSYKNYYGKLPDGVSNDLFQKLSQASNVNFAILFPDQKAMRALSDGMARKIVEGMDNFISGNLKRKVRIFSGHDTGVYSHYLLFNLTDLQCNLDIFTKGQASRPCESTPEFASSFIYELNQKTGTQDYYVRMLLNGKPMTICNENEQQYYCKYDLFKKTFGDRLFFDPDSFVSYCGNPLTDIYNKNNRSITVIVVTLIILGLTLIGALLATYFLTRWKNDMNVRADSKFAEV